MDELEQTRRLRAGDPLAFQEFFDSYADPLYRLANGLLQNPAEAEDVVQDAFIKVITRLDSFDGRSKMSTWLYRVVYNTAIDRLRRNEPVPLPDDADEPALPAMPQNFIAWDSPEKRLLDQELNIIIDQAKESLPDAYRLVFTLRDIEMLSTAETAAILEISPNLVKVRLHRARLILREKLAGYFTTQQAEN